ncbi:MAG: beta-galactosidase [Armatimonadetes bacterium]|nr:beta-galactosidase [Armatimonadota bacterium]
MIRLVILAWALLASCVHAQARSGVAPLQAGVVYFLPETPDESIAQLEAIQADGFNMIKIASWVWTVPQGGTPLRAVVDRTLDWCDAHGMAVWLLHNIQWGSPGEGGDVEKALTDPVADSRRSLEPWLAALKGHRCVCGVLLGNEVSPGGPELFDKHPAYLAAFQEWLKNQHGNVHALNRRWGTDFADFGDVRVPGDIGRGEIDVIRFNRRQFARFYDAIARELVRPALPDALCGSKGGASPYILSQMPSYTVASWDDLLANWPLWKTKLIVDTCKLPVFNSELHLYHDSYGFGPSVALSRYRYLTSAILGEWMTASFAWGAWSKPEIRAVHEATPGILADLRALEDFIRPFNLQPPAFHVLVTEQNEDGVGGTPPLELAYAHSAATGLPWRFVADIGLRGLDSPALVIGSEWLTQRTAHELAEMSAATRLVFVGDIPATDEYGEPLPGDCLAHLRRAGAIVPDWSRLRDVLNCPELPEEYREIVDVPYLWWSPERGHHQLPIRYPKLEARRVETADGARIVVINHTREAVTALVPFIEAGQSVADALTHAPVPEGPLEWPALAVRFLHVR